MEVKEAYCSFEVSKLLNGKGFDVSCLSTYDINNGKQYFHTSYIMCATRINAPTHQMACAWLREKYHIHISVNPVAGKGYIATIYDVADFDDYGIVADTKSYLHPEEAVEAALKYSLENLI